MFAHNDQFNAHTAQCATLVAPYAGSCSRHTKSDYARGPIRPALLTFCRKRRCITSRRFATNDRLFLISERLSDQAHRTILEFCRKKQESDMTILRRPLGGATKAQSSWTVLSDTRQQRNIQCRHRNLLIYERQPLITPSGTLIGPGWRLSGVCRTMRLIEESASTHMVRDRRSTLTAKQSRAQRQSLISAFRSMVRGLNRTAQADSATAHICNQVSGDCHYDHSAGRVRRWWRSARWRYPSGTQRVQHGEGVPADPQLGQARTGDLA